MSVKTPKIKKRISDIPKSEGLKLMRFCTSIEC